LEICDLEVAHFIEFIPGKADNDYEINIVEVHRDREWFKENVNKMKEFWDSVLKYRDLGIQSHPKFKNTSTKRKKTNDEEDGVTLDISEQKKENPLFIEDEQNTYVPSENNKSKNKVSLFIDE
jgi:hypothetical protein